MGAGSRKTVEFRARDRTRRRLRGSFYEPRGVARLLTMLDRFRGLLQTGGDASSWRRKAATRKGRGDAKNPSRAAGSKAVTTHRF
jgi:hypothetical protein